MKGDMVMFEDNSDWDALKQLYSEMVQQGRATYDPFVRYFIGQTGRQWIWADCEYTHTHTHTQRISVDH